MLIEINENKKENTLEVTIELPLQLPTQDPKQKLFTSHVKVILKEKGYDVDRCLGDATISNVAEHKRKGTWIFKLKDKPKKKVKKKKPKKVTPFAPSKPKPSSNEE